MGVETSSATATATDIWNLPSACFWDQTRLGVQLRSMPHVATARRTMFLGIIRDCHEELLSISALLHVINQFQVSW